MRHPLFCIRLFLFSIGPFTVSAQGASDSLAVQQLHMITFERVMSKNYQSWSVQYREFEKESQEFEIPITLSFGNTNIDGSFLENKNIKDVDTYTLGIGFDGYEYMGEGLYFNLGLGVLPGVETIERNTGSRNTRFLIGGTVNTGLLYVPFPDIGFVLGLNVNGRLSNSKVLDRALGFGIEAGFNF